jgi:hypothetical protein
MIDLKPIKEMLENISTTPWELDEEDGNIDAEGGGMVCFIQPHGNHHTIFRTGETYSHADGEFIAAAPTIIRNLIEEIDRLTKELGHDVD